MAHRLDLGTRRKNQEDDLAVSNNAWVLSDGMGGHPKGEYASSIAVNTVMYNLKKVDATDWTADYLEGAMLAADIATKECPYGVDDWERNPRAQLGATIVVACVVGDKIYGGWLGDSRIGVLSKLGRFSWVTKDHHDPMVGLQSVTGHMRPFSPVGSFILNKNTVHRLLLCSDGLSNVVSKKCIGDILTNNDDPEVTADRLVAETHERGAIDNIGIIVVEF